MIILGLTGSIGMGKTSAANQLRGLGIPVHDADDSVHRLLKKGGAAVPLVEKAFPGVVFGGVVERSRLGARVFGDPQALKTLENILHPLVRADERRFLQRANRQGKKIVALDIPLLFETHGDKRVDAVAVVTCPAFLQEQRVMARHGMTHGKLEVIRDRQMSDSEKRRRADFVIPTGSGRRRTLRMLQAAVAALRLAAPKRNRSSI
ncbi:MAG TPA: dephospho-CoA kinase [Patescibacteria group bacterium]|nr:dephospho-CoA kinase [Patescibacteria group bacterium]